MASIRYIKTTVWLVVCLTVLLITPVSAEETWPKGNKVAISLSYDDALNSQLDNALPALNQRGLKASFYVVPLSQAFKNRIEEWKLLAKQGHELGNHTLFHACDSNKPGREWVDPLNALNDKTLSDMVNEVTVANTLLTAIDGHTTHTMTPPCFDQMAKDGNYVDAVKDQFIGIKSLEDPNFAVLLTSTDIGAQEIIAFIEKQPSNIKLINILFHGIGGDHLVTSTAEHAKLLDYLVANEDKYWVNTYRNIMLAKSVSK